MERKKILAAQIAGKAAKKALWKDVDRTTCMTFNQPSLYGFNRYVQLRR